MQQSAISITKTNRFGMLSIACSLGLIPAAMVFGETAFFALGAVNFALFHSIWVSQYFKRPRPKLSEAAKGMRLPLLFFAVCGNVAWVFLAKTSGLSFAV